MMFSILGLSSGLRLSMEEMRSRRPREKWAGMGLIAAAACIILITSEGKL